MYALLRIKHLNSKNPPTSFPMTTGKYCQTMSANRVKNKRSVNKDDTSAQTVATIGTSLWVQGTGTSLEVQRGDK